MEKNGFIFIETIVIVAILTFSLLVVYTSYNSAITKEKNRLKYNDTVYLYRTYNIVNYLKNNGLKNMKSLVKDNALIQFNCRHNILNLSIENQKFCDSLFIEYHIKKIYISKNDVSFVQNCTSSIAGDCSIFASDQNLYNYVKTIGDKGTAGYRIIVEYSETLDGKRCGTKRCQFNFATISLGEIA